MPPRDWKMRIQDILDAIAAIQEYTFDMTAEAVPAIGLMDGGLLTVTPA